MFGKRCTLCGGKLDHNICTECGLDNTKTDKYYKLNQSSCDGEPLTHVHGDVIEDYHENTNPQKQSKKQPQKMQYHMPTVDTESAKKSLEQLLQGGKNKQTLNQDYNEWQAGTENRSWQTGQNQTATTKTTKQKKKGILGKVITVIVILSLVSEIGGTIIKSFSDSFSNSFSKQISDIGDNVENATGFSIGNGSPDYAKDGEYDYVSRGLKTGSDTVDATLSSGFYEVGVQIPEGSYTLTLVSGSGYFTVDDIDNSIYIWGNMSEDSSYGDAYTEVTDVRMYQGAMLQIEGNVTLQLTSETATADGSVELIANPLTEAVTLDKDAVVGEEIPAGVYDLSAVSGNGWVELYVPGFTSEDADGEEFQTDSVDLAKESDYTGETMKNVVLPEGTKLKFSGVEVKFTPSETIASEDYTAYYKKHY